MPFYDISFPTFQHQPRICLFFASLFWNILIRCLLAKVFSTLLDRDTFCAGVTLPSSTVSIHLIDTDTDYGYANLAVRTCLYDNTKSQRYRIDTSVNNRRRWSRLATVQLTPKGEWLIYNYISFKEFLAIQQDKESIENDTITVCVLFLGLLCHSAHFQLAATSIRELRKVTTKISKECFASLETVKKSIAHIATTG